MAIPRGSRRAARVSNRFQPGRPGPKRGGDHAIRGRAQPFATVLQRVSAQTGEPRAGGVGSPRGRWEAGGPERSVSSETRERAHGQRADDGSFAEPSALEPFRAIPVLQPPSEASAPVGSGLERAQAAAMAERLLHSVRVGKVAGGHEVRLTLADAPLEVRLRQQGDALVPELHLLEGATAADWAEAERLAARLGAELARAGLDFDEVTVVH